MCCVKMTKEHLIVFTRYPEPGKTKTRLIPALGAQGAADIQRQMTEYTLSQAKELQLRSVSVEVRYDGGKRQLMQDWLGYDIVCRSQGKGDLGSRMMRSHQFAVKTGRDYVVIIGTDCPGLNVEVMTQAFHKLHLAYDLVLGPAIDGGYYLIGLSRLLPELFTGISWGTAEVLQQTVAIAQKLNLSIAYLAPLADVDRPEDLSIWTDIMES
ncbi:MAG: TIGR04282 family arsenosugar biosynthesis glycosyltransferase [Chroococcidiopsidaceae cyanobacterium CP_BM_RX_35]|nr:TIGR04282 family arsenosugar biosynthesis glycosyltransferase [Chroococcidiopsidaceae cyanobacterium CP_BM_RX_35]